MARNDELRSLLPSTTELERLQGLALRPRRSLHGGFTGRHRGARQGFSVEFSEHRDYSPGDDPRFVDWKVWGKRDRLYLKQFEEETILACHVVVDASESMAYRSSGARYSKWDYAARLATGLVWLVLRQQDAAGLIVFGDNVWTAVAPSMHPHQLSRLAHVLTPIVPRGRSQLNETLGSVASRIHRRGIVVVVSDLFDETDSVRRGLRQLVAHGHDVAVVQTIDPEEEDFSFTGPVRLDGLEGLGTESIDPRSLRRAYRDEFRRFLTESEQSCRGLSVDYVRARTDEPPVSVLRRLLTQRHA